MLFIGTQFSNLYTVTYSLKGRGSGIGEHFEVNLGPNKGRGSGIGEHFEPFHQGRSTEGENTGYRTERKNVLLRPE